MPILIDLFLTFNKIGLFTFGGGYAMISIIENTCVKQKCWITYDEMMTVTVIAESTPGPIAINCATFIGYKKANFLGAIIATLGIIMPSFIIILAISMALNHFLEVSIVLNAFKGIKIAVGILILNAGITMTKKMKKATLPKLIMTCSFIIMFFVNLFSWNFSTIPLILLAALINLIIEEILG